MGQPKNPTAGQPPAHHHHQGPPAAGPEPGLDNEVNPEDLHFSQVADFLNGTLPDNVLEVRGRFQPAPKQTQKPPEGEPKDQATARVLGKVGDGILKDRALLTVGLGELFSLVCLLEEIDPEAVRQALPFNSPQVRAGGYAMLRTCLTEREAEALGVDVADLGRHLAQGERIRRLRSVVDVIYEILDANESRVLSHLAEIVDGGLVRGASVIKANAALRRALAAALAIKGAPVQAGLQSRGQNARRDEAVRADEQAKHSVPPEGHKGGTTTTVTTQTGAAPSSSNEPASKGTAGHKGSGKNKGQ